MRGRWDYDAATARFGGLNLSPQQLRAVNRVLLTACGTSWHAAMAGEYQIEALARLPVEVEYASELRYRNPPLDNNTLVFAITQSGETADTLAARRGAGGGGGARGAAVFAAARRGGGACPAQVFFPRRPPPSRGRGEDRSRR